jgi:hypothetical protein
MAQFEEPDTLAFFDRCWQGQREQLRLECHEYHGHPVYTLRLYWMNEAGDWRWQRARASSSGRYWAALTLKPQELHLLGLALLEEAAELVHRAQTEANKGGAEPAPRASRAPSSKEQAELDNLGREHPPMRDDPSIPF